MSKKQYFRPADKSLQAFKDAVISATRTFSSGAKGKESDLTDAEWINGWKEFWGDLTQEEIDKVTT